MNETVVMSSENELAIYNEVKECECCQRCALRYIGADFLSFSEPEATTITMGLESPIEDILAPKTKKMKRNPCAVCVGLLEQEFIDAVLLDTTLDRISDYITDAIKICIHVPNCILIRDRSMQIHLKDKFGDSFDESKVVNVNKAFRVSTHHQLEQILKKKIVLRNFIMLRIKTFYDLDRDECMVLRRFNMGTGKNDRYKTGKRSIRKHVPGISSEEFKQFVNVPPRPPLERIRLVRMFYDNDPMYVYGTLKKYKRGFNIYQLKEEHDTILENSVQTVIIKAFETVLGSATYQFVAAGSDEPVFRILGNGRPFYVSIRDYKFNGISLEQFQKIKDLVSSSACSIDNLTFTKKAMTINLMEMAQIKPKTYEVLCQIAKVCGTKFYMDKINKIDKIKVKQKTPIKLLHRRHNVQEKVRTVLSLEAKPIEGKDDILLVTVIADAGLHIPEFFHGDLGRTRPCLKQLIGAPIDFFAIDVIEGSQQVAILDPGADNEEDDEDEDDEYDITISL